MLDPRRAGGRKPLVKLNNEAMKNSRLHRQWFSLILTALASGCGPTGSSSEPVRMASGGTADTATTLVRVTPIKPARKTLVRWTEQPGHIEAFEETPLFAKVAGYVEKMHVDIGDPVTGRQFDEQGKVVHEGQLLAEIAVPELDEEYQQKEAAIGQAQADVVQATAAIKVAKAAEVSSRAKVEETEAVLGQAQADYDFAESEFTRLKKLADRGAVTREVAEEKEKQFRAAESVRRQTQAKIASAKAVVVEKRALIEKAEADLEAMRKRQQVAEADLQRVKALLSYTKIRAPYDGVVTARNVHTGHLVEPGIGSAGKALLVVVQTRVMRIFVDVPEGDAPSITVGSEAQVGIPSLPSEKRKGTVTRTAWNLDSAAHTLRTELDLPNDDGVLRPGMYAHARVKVAERENALSLPKSAVMTAEGKSFCFTIDADGLVVRTPVETGVVAGDDIEIVSGLTGDEQVIGVNAAAFREGQQVEVAQAGKP
jgi:RND family efflux transporter MFP subunit